MLTRDEALALVATHLGSTSRARHCLFVAYAMGRVAEHIGADADLWEVVGLAHDLDFNVTAGDRSRHGLVTVEWLSGRLPEDALSAIAAHDHRTGIHAETTVALGLRLCDAVAVVVALLGRTESADTFHSPDAARRLQTACAQRPHLPQMINELSARIDVPISLFSTIARHGPAAS